METWDLYDKDRNKLNKTVEAQSKLSENEYRLVIHVCFFIKTIKCSFKKEI